jgi:hypothetical protein
VAQPPLPALPLEPWEPTKNTLHLWAQIVGKVALGTAPPQNHWWHTALRVDPRGLRTRTLHHDGVRFDLAFDFVLHELIARTGRGQRETIDLRDGLSVADFDAAVHELLGDLGADVPILEVPYGVPMTTPFREDREHASYDADAVERWFAVMSWADEVLQEFAGWFTGKTSPVHAFWHSFDLAVTRFSGRRAPVDPGADPVTREAYSHEVVSFGFWAGDATVREPMFYSYTAPEPEGLADRPLAPDAASWGEAYGGSMALLPYDAVRASPDPRAALLQFLQSAYDAGAGAAGWDRDDLRSSYAPA